jgi:hypothetical protein
MKTNNLLYFFAITLGLTIHISPNLKANKPKLVKSEDHISYISNLGVIVEEILVAKENIYIKAGRNVIFPGIIQGINIIIEGKNIDITGTIICDGLCIIKSKNKVKPNSFRRMGSGIFIINGEEYNITTKLNDEETFDEETLYNLYYDKVIPQLAINNKNLSL